MKKKNDEEKKFSELFLEFPFYEPKEQTVDGEYFEIEIDTSLGLMLFYVMNRIGIEPDENGLYSIPFEIPGYKNKEKFDQYSKKGIPFEKMPVGDLWISTIKFHMNRANKA